MSSRGELLESVAPTPCFYGLPSVLALWPTRYASAPLSRQFPVPPQAPAFAALAAYQYHRTPHCHRSSIFGRQEISEALQLVGVVAKLRRPELTTDNLVAVSSSMRANPASPR